ncbi:MAG: hypothetical protein GYB68_16560 [Chloroflexi bacterium]|nr:hypothetical protein [Chloroflexota bacterium]
MPVSTCWYNEEQQRTVLFRYEGITSWDQWFDAIDHGHQMMQSVDHPVHTLSDFTGVEELSMEKWIAQMPRLGMAVAAPPNLDLVVVAGLKGLPQQIANVFSNVYKKVHMVDTLEEGVALIEAREQEGLTLD